MAQTEGGLGAALRSLRRSRGLSLEEAARQGGTAKATLGAWEVETRQPRGPALARLLNALGADDRTKAGLLSLADPRHARIALADSPFAPTIEVGMVLRSMRERRGLSQSDLARNIRVSQSTISRWEAGDDAPSPESLHAFGFALGASVEETLALASAAGTGGAGLPEDPEDALAQVGRDIPYALREAAFLGWEAELERRATRDARWDAALVLVLSRRAAWLVGEERYRDIASPARRAIRLATNSETRYQAVPALAALGDADRRLGRGHASVAELAGEWATGLPDSFYRAWMLRQKGMNLVRLDRTFEGLSLVERSAEVDLEVDLETPPFSLDPWAYRTPTLCEALLEAGEPKRAVALLGGRRERKFHPGTLIRVGHAVGQAATPAEMAYVRHWMGSETSTPLNRRRFDEIERRQKRLTGQPLNALPISEEKDAECLWAAVLRDHRG